MRSSLAVCMVALCACRGDPSPAADATAPESPSSTCRSDEDCTFSRGCCGGCGDLSAPYLVLTQAEHESVLAACDPFEKCPTYDCASAPPCHTSVRAACIDGGCGVRALSVELDAPVGPCNCDDCGPAPDLNGPCAAYHQLMFEHCCCMHSGVEDCAGSQWHGWAAACKQRDQCADKSAIAVHPDLDGCRATETRAHDEPPPGDFARRWVESVRSSERRTRMIIWEKERGVGFIDPATGERTVLGIIGSGSPGTPHLFPTPDGRAVVMSGYNAIAFARPLDFGSVDVVRALSVDGSPDVFGVSADMTTLLLRDFSKRPTTWSLVAFDPRRAIFRGWAVKVEASPAFLGGVLSPDGREALVEIGCEPQPCATTLSRLRMSGEVTPLVIPGARNARWLSDDRLMFEITDEQGSRLVSAPRTDPTATVSWREGAWSPAVTPAGRVAYLVASEACRAAGLVGSKCLDAKLETAAIDGGDVRSVASGVGWIPGEAWSQDGAWIAFHVGKDTGTDFVRVCRADGSACRDVGDVWIRGWLL